jgi:hypothetical protein
LLLMAMLTICMLAGVSRGLRLRAFTKSMLLSRSAAIVVTSKKVLGLFYTEPMLMKPKIWNLSYVPSAQNLAEPVAQNSLNWIRV